MGDRGPWYHVELKSFPNVARAFDLDRATLDRQFVQPFVAGEPIEYGDRRWAADRTRITVYEAGAVGAASRGLGRGWGEVTRRGREVTETVIAEIHRGAPARPEVEALKAAIAEVAAGSAGGEGGEGSEGSDGIGLPDVIALAVAAQPGWRVSEQLALAEQGVWEMLHRGRLEMVDGEGAGIASEAWQTIVLSWAQWDGDTENPVRLRALPPDGG